MTTQCVCCQKSFLLTKAWLNVPHNNALSSRWEILVLNSSFVFFKDNFELNLSVATTTTCAFNFVQLFLTSGQNIIIIAFFKIEKTTLLSALLFFKAFFPVQILLQNANYFWRSHPIYMYIWRILEAFSQTTAYNFWHPILETQWKEMWFIFRGKGSMYV